LEKEFTKIPGLAFYFALMAGEDTSLDKNITDRDPVRA
jgi:hypothetical protein